VIHELATNATKYGSLSQDFGHVSIVWAHEANRVRLVWQETGGPLVEHPTTKGFGSVLIERAFLATAVATCVADYRPEGLVFEVAFSTAAALRTL
jgi:two-component sensor histidine kinase